MRSGQVNSLLPIVKNPIIILKIFLNYYQMLGDLQKVEDNFYSTDSIDHFLKAHPIEEAIQMLNKATKNETKSRIRKFFYKLNDSNRYKQLLMAGLNEAKEPRKQFAKYIASENSQQYFELLQKKVSDVVILLDSSITLVPVLFSLVHSPSNGLKMIKLFSELYQQYGEHNCLYSEEIRAELEKGLQTEDSVVQMRFVEIIANIAIHGGKAFNFVKEPLEKSLNLYNTEDILLKLNIVQIISVLGQGHQTSQLLRGHKVWTKVEKDALDPEQQFYVRKSLLVLLVSMSVYEQYQITPKFTKSTIQFLNECFKGQGEYLEAGLEVTSFLFRSNDGAKIVVQNSQVFALFLKLSRHPQDKIKNLFIECLISLSDKTNGKKTKAMVLNIINCIGNPNLGNGLSQNINSNNSMVQGISEFVKWFSGLLSLPFEDLQIKLIHLFANMLEFTELCEELFEDQGVTKYILRPIGKGNTTKVLRQHKNEFVTKLIEKGAKEWKNTKLETYAVMIEKQLLKDKMEVEYALDVS